AIASATRRLRTKRRASCCLYARLIAVMYVVIALVVDHSASTSPIAVAAMLCAGCASSLRRLEPTRLVAWDGITWSKWCITDVIVPGPTTSVKTPTTTSKTDGIAKNALYASADASIIALSARNDFPARTTIAVQRRIVLERSRGLAGCDMTTRVETHDVAVIGAGSAGLATAALVGG